MVNIRSRQALLWKQLDDGDVVLQVDLGLVWLLGQVVDSHHWARVDVRVIVLGISGSPPRGLLLGLPPVIWSVERVLGQFSSWGSATYGRRSSICMICCVLF